MKSICLSLAAVALLAASGCGEQPAADTPSAPKAPSTDLGTPAGGEAGSTVKPGAPAAAPAGDAAPGTDKAK